MSHERKERRDARRRAEQDAKPIEVIDMGQDLVTGKRRISIQREEGFGPTFGNLGALFKFYFGRRGPNG